MGVVFVLLLLLAADPARSSAILHFFKASLPPVLDMTPNPKNTKTFPFVSFWPTDQVDRLQESAGMSLPRSSRDLIDHLVKQSSSHLSLDDASEQEWKSPIPGSLAAAWRPGDLSQCPGHRTETNIRSKFLQHFASESLSRNANRPYPFSRTQSHVICDVCQRVSRWLRDRVVPSDLIDSQIPKLLRLDDYNLDPDEVCKELLSDVENEMDSRAAAPIHPRDAPEEILQQLNQEWNGMCVQMVNDFAGQTSLLAKLFFYHKQFALGGYALRFPEVNPNLQMCTLASCCSTRGTQTPNGGDLELLDEFVVAPHHLAAAVSAKHSRRLGCALATQRTVVSLEVVVDTTIGHLKVFGVPVEMKSKPEWNSAERSRMTRLITMRLDHAFHMQGAKAAGMRVRWLARALSGLMTRIFKPEDWLTHSLESYVPALNLNFDGDVESDVLQAEIKRRKKGFNHKLLGNRAAYRAIDTNFDRKRQYPATVWPQGMTPESDPSGEQFPEPFAGLGAFIQHPSWQVRTFDRQGYFRSWWFSRNTKLNDLTPKDEDSNQAGEDSTTDTRFASSDEEDPDSPPDWGSMAQSKPTTIFDVASYLLLLPAYRAQLVKIQQVVDQAAVAFRDFNPSLDLPELTPDVLDIDHNQCNPQDRDGGEMAPAVPDILDIRLMNAWGHVEISSVFQTQIPISWSLAIAVNKEQKYCGPRSVLCGLSLPTHLPVELRMSIVKARSANPWKLDVPHSVQGVEWYVGREKMSGKYVVCLLAQFLATATGLPLCPPNAPQDLECVSLPPQYGELLCSPPLPEKGFSCREVAFPEPKWKPGESGDQSHVDTFRVQSIGDIGLLREGYGRSAAAEFCHRQGMSLSDSFVVEEEIVAAVDFKTFDGFGNECKGESGHCLTFSNILCTHCQPNGQPDPIQDELVIAKPCEPGTEHSPECSAEPYMVGTVLKTDVTVDGGQTSYQVQFRTSGHVVWVSRDVVELLSIDHKCRDK